MTSIPLLTGMLVKLLINAVFLPPACPKTSRLVRVCPPTPTSKTRLTSGRQIRFSKFEVNGICTVRYRYTVARHTIMLGLRIGGIGYGDRSSVHRRPANRVGVGAPNLTLAVGVADGASSVDAGRCRRAGSCLRSGTLPALPSAAHLCRRRVDNEGARAPVPRRSSGPIGAENGVVLEGIEEVIEHRKPASIVVGTPYSPT